MESKNEFVGLIALKDPHDIYDAQFVLVRDKRLMEYIDEAIEFPSKGYLVQQSIPIIGDTGYNLCQIRNPTMEQPVRT